MKTRALVTGGAGFIGSHLSEELLSRGWKVHVIDNLSTGSIENIEHLKGQEGFSYTIDTFTNRRLAAELVDRADFVFHLAAAVGVKVVVEQPIRTIETNIRLTESVLELSAKKGKNLLIASTSEVYGKGNSHSFSEDDDVVLGPTSRSRWCYAASKMIDEFLAIAYARNRGLPVTVARFFNTIGPRQTGLYGMVVPRFVTQAIGGEPITVYGDGNQRRSFTWIGDVVNATIDLIQHPDAVGRVFNIGHTEEISIIDLARLIVEEAGCSSEIVRIPFEQAYADGFEDVPRRLPNISKLRALTGYEPSLGLREMIGRIIEYERERSREP